MLRKVTVLLSELFVHFSSIVQDGYRSLEKGQQVEFTVGDGPKRPQAQEVKVVK